MHTTSTVFIMIIIKPIVISFCASFSSILAIFIVLFCWNYFSYITKFLIRVNLFCPSI
nr:MAG TPA: hypothetical protein [Caudoviricetes sp.]